MNKLVSGYMVIFLICAIIDAFFKGGGAATSMLAFPVTTSDVSIAIVDTTGFADQDIVNIDDEDIRYTSIVGNSLTGCTRGYNSTTAAIHNTGTYVYTMDTGTINKALGFDIASSSVGSGAFSVLIISAQFLVKVIPNVVLWNFAFFEGQLVYLRYILMAVGVGLIVYFGFIGISAAVSATRRT